MADALDFSKIWEKNGNVTYDFTDDNYLKGWNFIGNVPPARGMFDKLQQLGDMKDQYLYNQLKELTTKQYTVDDTLKPTANEAVLATLLSNLANEVKQNKGTDDWKTAPATNLATLAALVGNLASGSDVTWDGNKFTNAKLGITGLMEQNGYICFGKNFGGLILQWGNRLNTNPFPIEFPTACLAMIAGNITRQGDRVDNTFAYPIDRTKYYMSSKRSDMNAESGADGNYVAIGV